MGKLRSFRIILNGEEPVYYPGDGVQGCCELEVVDGELSFKTLSITLRGLSKVHWAESRNVGARLGPYTQHFMSGDQYIRERKVLAQPRMGADRVTLREGRYTFPFVFVLPSGTMPSSFDGKYGSTRYWLRSEMNRIGRPKLDKTKKTISFVNPLNVSLAEYQDPVESAADKMLCCGLCAGGLVSIAAHTDKSGYVPGETISLSAAFENFTRRRLRPTAALYQRQYYFASDRQKMRTLPLTKFRGSYLSSKCNSTWSNERLTIPNVTPTITNCSILRLVYFVKISLKIPGSLKLSAILPITIGSDRSNGGGSNMTGGLVLSPPPYQEHVALPTYDNCSTSGDEDDYLHPPNSRLHTPPPCYSDIYDSDSDDEAEETEESVDAVDQTDPQDIQITAL